jgi:translation initiation factor 3 subunit F
VLGRYLADTMAVVPQIDRQDFERLFNENVQDVLLVSYLSNLVRVQLALADKLGTAALPVL